MGWLMFLLIGLIAGFIAEKVMKRNHGLIKNLVVGVVGAFVGGFLAQQVGIAYAGFVGTLIVATVGAIIVLWLFALLAGR
ncbi:GlsB/YeaQ/YmgE family stress response membrane protein [Hoeflea prorocentri]|uniref:GlsB/YeaQ/YmgE family stress response membrane protein n=1 Tax=Hoeflea prorocentri TaxID=1922333 RepID=A0A9X3ZHB4_9HYPH|nr:GlsB/YeaQ/YmgE family stress response membrane protein [Hoeflea prorocentri]MCY6380728.1 GlsB/YeaQ/YmgE family stress response membrane protein [Hoeflea prorocentri]MDA5398528.1 GlsB/YeaQ/YmgE family stress response membrane protein [Hoeflea prorocentri]